MEIAEIREVRIHIDEQPYHSPNPTTGAALYALGHVVAGFELYREVTGDREDEPIENGPETVHLKEDEHFHSGPPKVYTVIVNGRKKEVLTKTLSFDQVVGLAFNPVPVGPNVQFSVTYRKGPPKNHEGTLTEGETVRIKDGMIFDVTETNKS
ncbi:MAG: multiubiquitin domain-containing protein [Bryobacteraceae bacterium]